MQARIILTSSSLKDVEAGQECRHVASASDITWLQTHGRKLLTVDKHQIHDILCHIAALASVRTLKCNSGGTQLKKNM